MTQIKDRIAALRTAMQEAGVSAYIVPGTDPHASEYIADHWKDRVWISGFTGSAGTVAFTLQKGGLWTDSRYFLQAADQLKDTGINLMKLGMPETPDIASWIISELKTGNKVGVNPQMFSINAYAAMKAHFQKAGIELVSTDLMDKIWSDRPALPKDKLFVYDKSYAGKSAAEKLMALRAEMKKMNANAFVLSVLDDIAWLFNIRGTDVSYNPVVTSFALVDANKAMLFVDPEKVEKKDLAYFKSENIELAAYDEIYATLNKIPVGQAILIDGSKLNQSLYEAITPGCVFVNTLSPVTHFKSIKNETEIDGFRRAMVKDGVALVQFFKWLEENVGSGNVNEVSLDEKLSEFRSKQKGFMGASFGSIAGYGPHGAIVHYSATHESASTLKPEGIFLLDSGGQYIDGTTDITRTISLGNPTDNQKKDFTLVLKGHIALSRAVFPAGTRGSQIDMLARKALWENGLNYGHGTGHGIGHFLNVHEGPQSIRAEENPVTLKAGMVISNEPGLYRSGEYGIRTENLVLVVPAIENEFGSFLQFETLTLFPIDQNLMDITLLDNDEEIWIDNYHQTVYDQLSPYLNEDEKKWLKSKCSPLYDLIF
ncbi:MAG: aminopeptidase P family protein [Paludibacter sp.]|nr:aminopeptidase P family protein [Paludibacter sp.]